MQGIHVLLACAAGAFIGSLVALEIHASLWWLGLLVGGGTGYILYDFQEVIRALRYAWRLIPSWRPDWRDAMRNCARALRFAGWEVLGVLAFLTNAIPPLLVFVWCVSKTDLATSLIKMGLVLGCMAAILSGFCFLLGLASWLEGKREPVLAEGLRIHVFATLCYYLPLGALLGLWYAGVGLWEGGKFGYRFGKIFFLLIHSDFRLLCGVDAALGAAVGYFCDSALVGTLAGGLIGGINFEVVSKRLLRVQTVRRR